MTQIIAVIVIVVGVLIIGYWIWSTWFKGTAIGQTTTGTIISAAFDTASLTANLGYVELLNKIDVIKASPDAMKACDILADTLWAGAIVAWKTMQTAAAPTVTTTVTKTAKVTTTSGTVVEVPVS